MTERSTRLPTAGEAAERLVVDRLRAVLGPEVAVFPNVRWFARDHGTEHEGEADVVIGDPERGLLVLEVKSGAVRRDANGTWWTGAEPLKHSPFQQASESRHALVKKLHELQAWPPGRKPINGHGVAFPDVDLDTMRGRLGLDVLGPDAEPDLIADQSMFVDDEAGRERWGIAHSGSRSHGRSRSRMTRRLAPALPHWRRHDR